MTLSASELLSKRHQPRAWFADVAAVGSALDDDDLGALATAVVLHTPALVERAAAAVDDAPSPDGFRATARRVAVMSSAESPALDDDIDAWLEDEQRAPAVIDGLLRANTDWYHPALPDQFRSGDDAQSSFGAAVLLARTAPEELEEAIADVESTSRKLIGLRAACLAGSSQWFDSVLEWRNHLAESESDEQLDDLDAALATLDFRRYARSALMGDLNTTWLNDDRCVADFLSRHGFDTWIAVLALFRHVRDRPAFELSAAFGTCAALVDAFDDVEDDQLRIGEPATWLVDAPDRSAFHLAIGGGDEFAARLVEATLHHCLRQRGYQPPPVQGLPLSGPFVDADELGEAIAPFDDLDFDDPKARVALVRTLVDLVTHARRKRVSPEAATATMERFCAATDAVGCLADAFDDNQPPGRPADWGCRGLHRLLWASISPDATSVRMCAESWFCGPVERASTARVFFASLVTELEA